MFAQLLWLPGNVNILIPAHMLYLLATYFAWICICLWSHICLYLKAIAHKKSNMVPENNGVADDADYMLHTQAGQWKAVCIIWHHQAFDHA